MTQPDDPSPPPAAATDAQPNAPATREQIGHAVHALRNSMNTLLMNAAVIGAGSKNLPEAMRPFVEQIAKSGRQCSEDLASLFALVDTHRR